MNSMKKVRFAVVGVGRMGGAHAFLLSRGLVKNALLAAVADISDGALNSVKRVCKKGLLCFNSYREMAEKAEFDAVIVAVPHYFHVEIAKFFIEKGKHVLIEKPIAVTVGEAMEFNRFLKGIEEKTKGIQGKTDEKTEEKEAVGIHKRQEFNEFLREAEEKTGGIHGNIEEKTGGKPKIAAAVMYNQRTNPVYKKAKELLSRGAIGEIRRINFIVTDWYRSDAYYKNNSWRATWGGEGGGILINQCVHQLDVLQWLVGMPKSVYARAVTKGRNIAAENEVTAFLRYENDVFCSLSASGRELNGTNRIEIAGDSGRLVIGKNSMKFISWKPPEPEVNAATVKGYGGAKKRVKRYFYGPRSIPDGIFGQQRRITANFAAHILKGERLISPAQEGIFALSLINGIYMSAWEGKEIEFPIDAERYEELLRERVKEER
ncbi:MAG: Gfo/Idh/MocA family oxidoreductase [Clostridiales bacterium]|jgi:predicted dehydrogenase|nr:Gfo/Idh/MocA family oxidoreductase [Clostridiales bacterium]